MDFSTLSTGSDWLIAHGYPLMFVAMCFEGPIVTIAASFAAALGHFNIFVILLLSILGDMLPDIIFYCIGFYGRLPVVERMGHRVGLSAERLKKAEAFLKRHTFKAVAAAKFTPVIPTVGLALIGAFRLDFRRFMLYSFLITFPRSVICVIFGYYFGWAYDAISVYMSDASLIAVAIFIIAIAYMIYVRVQKRINESLKDAQI